MNTEMMNADELESDPIVKAATAYVAAMAGRSAANGAMPDGEAIVKLLRVQFPTIGRDGAMVAFVSGTRASVDLWAERTGLRLAGSIALEITGRDQRREVAVAAGIAAGGFCKGRSPSDAREHLAARARQTGSDIFGLTADEIEIAVKTGQRMAEEYPHDADGWEKFKQFAARTGN